MTPVPRDTLSEPVLTASDRREIVFIENNVADFEKLAQSIGAAREVIVLDAGQDGLAQILRALDGRSGIDALHLITHGSAGQLDLGSLALDVATMQSRAADLALLGRALADGGDVLLYGCDVGAGSSGVAFLDQFAALTGADVAASDDLTGSSLAGGDWDLELQRGSIETAVVGDAAYQHTFKADPPAENLIHITFDADGGTIVSPGGDRVDDDLLYAVTLNGSQHTLKVDGKTAGVLADEGSAQIAMFPGDEEESVTFSFAGGEAFSPASLEVAPTWGYESTPFSLIAVGYYAGGTQGNPVVSLNYPGAQQFTFGPEFANIVRLVVAPNPNSLTDAMKALKFDNFKLSSIAGEVPAPTFLLAQTPNDNGTYKAGDEIDIDLNFSAPVDVTGTPELVLNVDGRIATASYVAAESTPTILRFTYTVQAGDNARDLDYAGTNALVLNGGTIKAQGSDTDAILTLAAPGTSGSLVTNKTIHIDTEAPAAPAQPLMVVGGALEAVGSSDVLTEARPVFGGAAGSVEGGADLVLYANGQPIGSGTAAPDGSWTITPSADLPDGTVAVTLTATDEAGNTSAASPAYTIEVDAQAPATIIATLTMTPDTGAREDDFITTEHRVTFSGTLSAPLGADERVLLSLDGGTHYVAATIVAGATGWTLDAQLAGSTTVVVVVEDTLGRQGASLSQPVVIDTEAPCSPSTPMLDAESDTGAADGITGETTPTFVGTGQFGTTVKLYIDGVEKGEAPVNCDGTWTIELDTPLADNDYTVTAKAVDIAGNTSEASGALAITVTTTAPDTTVGTISLSDDGGVQGDGITNVATQAFQGTLSAPLGVGEQVEVRVNGGEWQVATVEGSSWSLGAITFCDGDVVVEARVVDAVGNYSAPVQETFTVYSAAPTVTITTDPADLTTLNGEAPATIVFTLSEAPLEPLTREMISFSGGELSTLVKAEDSDLVYTAEFLPEAGVEGGMAIIAVQAGAFRNVAGSGNEASADLMLNVDTLPPAAPAHVQLAGCGAEGVTNEVSPSFTGSAPVGTIVILFDANGEEIGRDEGGTGTWTITPGTTFGEDANTVTAVAVDAAGNRSTPASFTFTVDTVAPTLEITSAAQELNVENNSTTITFRFSEDPGDGFVCSGENASIAVTGGTLDNFIKNGNEITATFTAQPGVNLGEATVTLSAAGFTDRAGNPGTLDQALTLTYDTQAPDAPDDVRLDTASDTGVSDSDHITMVTVPTFTGRGEVGATVTLRYWEQVIGSGTVDEDGIWRIQSTVELPEGNVDIMASLTDAAGNAALASTGRTFKIMSTAPATTVSNVSMTGDDGQSTHDFITSTPCGHVLSGELSAELAAGEYVRVSLDDGQTWTTVTQVEGRNWSVALDLAASGTIIAAVTNAAGGYSSSFSQDYRVLTEQPTATFSQVENVLKADETATITLTFSEDPGASFDAETDLVVQGGEILSITGEGKSYTITFKPTQDENDGHATIALAPGSYIDLAGNEGAAASVTVCYDTAAPEAPAAPTLAAASDTGRVGDGRTTNTRPVIEGTGEIGATIRLYDGTVKLGETTVGEDGNWSIQAVLAAGNHTLTATQADAAGNESAPSAQFALTIERTAAPAPSVPLVDGMPVTSAPVTLPGGMPGTSVNVPVVPVNRGETEGTPGVADIPLQTSGGETLLLAQLPTGYGLSSSGGNMGPTGLEALIAAIVAATPTHAPDDQGHLTGNGQSFLDQLAQQNLLVQTVSLTGGNGSTDPVTLTGTSTGTQGTALVIDSTATPGAQVVLQDVDFAAIVGQAAVTSQGAGTMLTGDAASQQFFVTGSDGARVFAGGGADTLSFSARVATPVSADGGQRAQVIGNDLTLLHAGQGEDVITFNGNRADWDVEAHHGHYVVSSLQDPTARAFVVNAEQLKFDDETIVVEENVEHEIIAGMYDHIMGRQADVFGFEWWANAREAGNSWGQIAMWMIDSSERANGFNGEYAHDIELLYQALFNRSVDEGGLEFWVERMEEGLTLLELADSMVESAEMVGYRVAATDWDFLV